MNFSKTSKACFTEEGLELIQESEARLKYLHLMNKLKTTFPAFYALCTDESAPNALHFIKNEDELLK